MRRALAPVRWWTRLYTLGLPRAIAEERCAELESDLWEEWRVGSERGLHPATQAASIWVRWLFGIPDDLAWRVEMAAGSPVPAGTSRSRLVGLSAGVAVAVALVLVTVAVNTIQYNEGTQPTGGAASILLLLAFGMAGVGVVVAARGFWIMGARRAEGTLLVVGGSTVAGLAWYWLFLPVVASVAVSAYAVWRAVSSTDGLPRTSLHDGSGTRDNEQSTPVEASSRARGRQEHP